MQLSITLASCRPTTSASCSLGESSEDYGDDDAVDGRMTSTSSPKTGVKYHHHHHHQSLNREGRWGTTHNFATSFLHFSLFATVLWDLPNSRPVHSLMLSSHLFLCPPCLLPSFTVPCKMVLARPDDHDHTIAVCVSLRSSGGLCVVQLPAGSWHGLPRW